jgi:biopolymer transport protein TolQ
MNLIIINIYNLIPEIGEHAGLINLILRATFIAKIVLAVLLFFSVVSWAIILDKYLSIKRAKRDSRYFLKIFKNSQNFKEVLAHSQKWRKSPFAAMFIAGNTELQYQLDRMREGNPNPVLSINIDAIKRQLVRAANAEVDKLQSQLSFLATTASATPFIGLFGTVIGIINAFEEIGRLGSSDLSVVAPGIAEALIATAMGLAAAIPAVIGYNYCVNQIKSLASDMEDFAGEIITIIEHFYKLA